MKSELNILSHSNSFENRSLTRSIDFYSNNNEMKMNAQSQNKELESNLQTLNQVFYSIEPNCWYLKIVHFIGARQL